MENGLTHRNWWYQQLFTNWKRFELVYVVLLILLQLVVY